MTQNEAKEIILFSSKDNLYAAIEVVIESVTKKTNQNNAIERCFLSLHLTLMNMDGNQELREVIDAHENRLEGIRLSDTNDANLLAQAKTAFEKVKVLSYEASVVRGKIDQIGTYNLLDRLPSALQENSPGFSKSMSSQPTLLSNLWSSLFNPHSAKDDLQKRLLDSDSTATNVLHK